MTEGMNNGLDLSILKDLNIPSIDTKSTPANEDGFVDDTNMDDLPVIDDPLNAPIQESEEDSSEEEVSEEELETEPAEEGSGDESVNKIWYEWAKERGLVDDSSDEEFEDSEEFLLKKFNARIEKDVEAYKDSLPPKIKELINHWEDNVPLEDLIAIESRQMEYASIKPEDIAENIELQKRLVSDWLYSQGFDESEIPSEIEKYEQAMLLEDRALTAQKKMAKFMEVQKGKLIEQAKYEQEQAKVRYEQSLKDFEKSVYDIKEIFPEVPLSEPQKKKIVELITKPVARTEDGRVINGLKKMELEDPNFLIKLAYMATLNWDITTITKKAAEAAPAKLRKSVKTYQENKLAKVDLKAVKSALSSLKRQNKF